MYFSGRLQCARSSSWNWLARQGRRALTFPICRVNGTSGVPPERAYSDHNGAEGVSHEHEDEEIPIDVTVERDVAPEVDEKSVEGYKEPRAMCSEEDLFADYSADISATEVEAQLEVSI
jgi:hypothetical protein